MKGGHEGKYSTDVSKKESVETMEEISRYT